MSVVAEETNLENAPVVTARMPEPPRRDVWDMLTAISPIISGLMTLAVGGYFTYVFNEHQLRLQEVQTIEKFIPRLAGDEQSKRAAILAISTLTSTELASKMASIYASSGTASALESMAENSDNEKEKQMASKALAATLEKMADNQMRVTDIEKLCKENIQRAANKKDAKPSDMAESLDKLAEAYMVQGQYALAEPLFQRSLTLRQQAYGVNSAESRRSLTALADLYRLKGDTTSYESYLKQAQAPDTPTPTQVVQEKVVEKAPEPAREEMHSAQPLAAEPKAAEATVHTERSSEPAGANTEGKQSEKHEMPNQSVAESNSRSQAPN